jgi:hypothetical protein
MGTMSLDPVLIVFLTVVRIVLACFDGRRSLEFMRPFESPPPQEVDFRPETHPG